MWQDLDCSWAPGCLAMRTLTTMAVDVRNSMGGMAQPKGVILGLTLGFCGVAVIEAVVRRSHHLLYTMYTLVN